MSKQITMGETLPVKKELTEQTRQLVIAKLHAIKKQWANKA